MKRALSIVVGLCGVLLPSYGSAQEHWVDDALVLGPKHVRLNVGVGCAFVGQRSNRTTGIGLNLEQAVGLGGNVEIGVRHALRLDRSGRGTRADEFARAADTEKFGTGSSITANPELRLTWRFVARRTLEVALENREVLPLPTDPDVTAMLGVRLRRHVAGLLRVDAAGYWAEIWQKYYGARVMSTALSLPAWVWVEPWRTMYVGMMSELRHTFATRYAESHSRVTVGLASGYRVGASDLQLAVYFADVVLDPALRVGAEPAAFYVPGVYNDSARRIGVGLTYSIVL